MPETCRNWLIVVKSYIHYAQQTREICQLLPYSVDFIVSGEFWNQLSKAVILNAILY